jgi:hypothetical protein
MQTKISFTAARLDDAVAMAKFLSDIPNSDDLAKLLQHQKTVASRAYDDETWTARYVASDGQVVNCFAVTNVTIDQAEIIAAACMDISASDEAALREAVARSLGPMPDPPE